LPGVSWPSSVVRSVHRIARSSAQSLDDLLIERLPSEAARSSAPTWSTLRTPRISEPRCVSDRAVAMGRIMRRSVAGPVACGLLLAGCGGGNAAAPSPTPAPTPSPTPSPSPTPQPLQRMEPSLPAPVEETAAAAAGGRLYVLGGFNAAGASLASA